MIFVRLQCCLVSSIFIYKLYNTIGCR